MMWELSHVQYLTEKVIPSFIVWFWGQRVLERCWIVLENNALHSLCFVLIFSMCAQCWLCVCSIVNYSDPKDRMVGVVKWYLSAFHAGRKVCRLFFLFVTCTSFGRGPEHFPIFIIQSEKSLGNLRFSREVLAISICHVVKQRGHTQTIVSVTIPSGIERTLLNALCCLPLSPDTTLLIDWFVLSQFLCSMNYREWIS